MAVVIRMKRSGRRNRPCYRISVADSRSPRDGRVIESLGLYDPVASDPEAQVKLDVERARHWLQHGALPSDTVESLFRRQGVFEGMKKGRPVRKRPGRKKAKTSRARRDERKATTAAAKGERRTQRVAAKRAAAKAAAAESAE